MLLRFKMGGSGPNGQGPGVIGGRIFPRAGEVITLRHDDPLVVHLRASSMVKELPPIVVEVTSDVVADTVALEAKLQRLHISALRRMAGVKPDSRLTKLALIAMILKRGEQAE